MKIIKTQVLRGPNRWSNYRNKLIQVKIDLEEMEQFPTDKITGFCERFKKAFPTIIEHECSEGIKGGFFERLERGTWLGHVIEHVALEIQSLAGMQTGYGRTRGTSVKGVYNMVFAYEVEEAGLFAAESAFRIVEALCGDLPYTIDADIQHLKMLKKRHGLGPSTKSIVDEAEKRGIPWKRLGRNSKIRFGYGKNSKTIQATTTAGTSFIGVNIAGDKEHTKMILEQAGIPVPKGDTCHTLEAMEAIIEHLGFPIVIKPLNGNHGKGASVNIQNSDAAKIAFETAQEFCDHVIVERFINGDDYRLLIVNGKFVAAARRISAHVTGNGHNSIRELMEIENSHPNRGDGHESVLTKITYDKDTFNQLEKKSYTLESIPDKDEIVYLKSTANISTGGTAIDVTDDVHPENVFMAERIAKIIGLDICGIDVMASDIKAPITKTGGAVIEVNAAPGFRMHLSPSEGKPRNIAKAVIDMLFPEGSESRVPLFAVTGTNGKTTTTRLLAHMAKCAGFTPGYTTTDGVYIGDYKVQKGDCTGPMSAGLVLSDPMVDFAVLETARGGLLRNGLSFNQCDVGIITNIREDHLGLNDINTLEELANVKAVVARSVKRSGFAVLNAEDLNCVNIAGEIDCNVIYFTLDNSNAIIREHIAKGGIGILVENNGIVIYAGTERIFVSDINEVPLTMKGTAKFMVANVLAATAAAYAYGFKIEQLQQALKTFIPSYEMTPGRMNLFRFKDFNVLVDYAHNPHGVQSVSDYMENVSAERKIGIITGVGDRRDADIIELAEIAARAFDYVIVRQDVNLRGRTSGELNALMEEGINRAGTGIKFDLIPDEAEAIQHAITTAVAGDFIVALSDDYEKVIKIITNAQDSQNEVINMIEYARPIPEKVISA